MIVDAKAETVKPAFVETDSASEAEIPVTVLEAQDWFDKAAAWMQANAKDDEELHRFRLEAEELLHQEEPDAPQVPD